MPRQGLRLPAHAVNQPEELALRRAAGAAGGYRSAGGDESGRAGRLRRPEVRAAIVGNSGFDDRGAAFRQVRDFVETIHHVGIAVALRTDSETRNGSTAWGTHHELELCAEAGLTPMQTFLPGTSAGANRLATAGEADVKTLEAGKSGHFIVLDARSADRHFENALARPGNAARRLGGARQAACGGVLRGDHLHMSTPRRVFTVTSAAFIGATALIRGATRRTGYKLH